MRITGFVMIICMLASCGMSGRAKVAGMLNDTTTGLTQARKVNGHAFTLSYLPSVQQVEGELPEWCFKLNIQLPEGSKQDGEGLQSSFGIDTLFHLITGKDTSAPLHAMRIANGNLRGIEYMIIFEKPLNPEDASAKFCFRDWLFTHQFLEFPLQTPAIVKIDSLSSRI